MPRRSRPSEGAAAKVSKISQTGRTQHLLPSEASGRPGANDQEAAKQTNSDLTRTGCPLILLALVSYLLHSASRRELLRRVRAVSSVPTAETRRPARTDNITQTPNKARSALVKSASVASCVFSPVPPRPRGKLPCQILCNEEVGWCKEKKKKKSQQKINERFSDMLSVPLTQQEKEATAVTRTLQSEGMITQRSDE